MILQDLIRNYILYREVVRPILKAWKDTLASGYYKGISGNFTSEFNLAINKARRLGDGEELGWDISDEYEAMSLTKKSGTRTITTIRTHLVTEYGLFSKQRSICIQASSSKSIHVLLKNSSSIDYIVGIGKTSASSQVLSMKTTVLCVTKTDSLTTGCESKQINSFLFETHEKREYLGEFSLTHEEIHLNSSKKGGGYHDIDQKSVAAII